MIDLEQVERALALATATLRKVETDCDRIGQHEIASEAFIAQRDVADVWHKVQDHNRLNP